MARIAGTVLPDVTRQPKRAIFYHLANSLLHPPTSLAGTYLLTMTPSIPKVQLGLPFKVLAQVCLGGFIKLVACSSKRSSIQPAATEKANLTSLPAPSQSAVSEEHEATSLSEESLSTTTKDDGPNLGTETKKRILKTNEKRDHIDDDCGKLTTVGRRWKGNSSRWWSQKTSTHRLFLIPYCLPHRKDAKVTRQR